MTDSQTGQLLKWHRDLSTWTDDNLNIKLKDAQRKELRTISLHPNAAISINSQSKEGFKTAGVSALAFASIYRSCRVIIVAPSGESLKSVWGKLVKLDPAIKESRQWTPSHLESFYAMVFKSERSQHEYLPGDQLGHLLFIFKDADKLNSKILTPFCSQFGPFWMKTTISI